MRTTGLVPPLLILIACTGAPDGAPPPADPEPGVARDLAASRAARIGELRYEVFFSIPAALEDRIHGREIVDFEWRGAEDEALVFDFVGAADDVLAVRAAGEDGAFAVVPHRVAHDHLIVEAEGLRSGANRVEIEFLAGDGSLNRQLDVLYTLFVPDRAHHAFPCFDQPDLKARYTLTLETPASWQAVANGELQRRTASGGEDGRALWEFAETEPISTYLFAFAAGRFEVASESRGEREMRMLHREDDRARLERNAAAIFDLHFQALDWLEAYTGIDYPFGKFDFVLIPAFQYGGMEHPGAILYRDSRLLLDEAPTADDLLGRASLIAHETAHMWFGDLVTMAWFDDVWLKEVFANFMAAKIAQPAFPEIDHDLRFLLAHFPAAYEVDRSAGTHPIRQPLDNLDEAGSLYGAIIYQKAPIVMRHLERIVGEEALRDGLREYLDRFRFANATWGDLIAILDARTEVDLAAWSRVWVDEAGRPTVRVEPTDHGVRLVQEDPHGQGRLWPQRLTVTTGDQSHEVDLDRRQLEVETEGGEGLVLAGAGGLGYGRFVLPRSSLERLLEDPAAVGDPVARAVGWLTLWDAMLEGEVEAQSLLRSGLRLLESEDQALLVDRVLRDLRTAYWRVLGDEERRSLAAEVETFLWRRLEEADAPGVKSSYFKAYVDLATTGPAVSRVERLWRGELEVEGLPLAESDLTTMALELAVREVDGWRQILDEQRRRITQSDRQARFDFVRQAVDADAELRDRFFASLRQEENRAREPWVIDALEMLHHPLRAETSEKYLLPSLELLEEIQRTGDIFFPKRWLDATFGGHRSAAAAATVRAFLDQRPGYPPRLRGKILQSSDLLLRLRE